MENQFPPNSHKSKESLRAEPAQAEQKPKVQRVVTTPVRRRKKPLGKRMKELFLGSDSISVKEYIVQDVVVPAIKDMVSDAVSGGVERVLFGDSAPHRRRYHSPGPSSNRGRVYTNYQGYSSRDARDRPPFQSDRRRRSVEMRERRRFDDILLATRAEGEDVLRRLYDLIETYEAATVSDLYEMLGISRRPTDDNWGWTHLHNSQVRRTSGGYLLDIPDPEPLD